MNTAESLRVARIIEEGLAIDALDGAAHAWVFLTAHGIPAATIRRLLADAQRQRAAGAELSDEKTTATA